MFKIIDYIKFKFLNIREFYLSKGVSIGDEFRIIEPQRSTFGSEPYLVKVGNHVTISANVRFVTHDGGVWVFRNQEPNIDVFGKIVIGNNVFIGINSIIMPGVHVGDNVVIGAGSIVTSSLEGGFVYAGIPARRLMSILDYKNKVDKKKYSIRDLDFNCKKDILKRDFNI